jgi:hypothetical protein
MQTVAEWLSSDDVSEQVHLSGSLSTQLMSGQQRTDCSYGTIPRMPERTGML